MKLKFFTFKNTAIIILLFIPIMAVTNKISENAKHIKNLNELSKIKPSTNNKEEILKQNKLNTKERLVDLHPNVEFSISSNCISAVIPLSANYNSQASDIIAKNIAIIGGENNILSKDWNTQVNQPNNITIVHYSTLNNGVPVTFTSNYNSTRYWNDKGFYSNAIKKRLVESSF